MPLDLLTVLVVRLCLGVMASLAFWVQSRRHPGVKGPGWWSAAAACSVLATPALWLRMEMTDHWLVSFANPLMTMTVALAWLGVRAHLGLKLPLSQVVWALLAFSGVNALLHEVWDLTPARLAQARRDLLALDLIAYDPPLYQVLSLPGTATAALSLARMRATLGPRP